jgi:endonuclease YncB( thermonuclease family)
MTNRPWGPYTGLVLDWHDGDTVHMDLDLGFGTMIRAYDLKGHPVNSGRIYLINAPELGSTSNPNPAGIASRDNAIALCPPGTLVQVTSYGWDKYGGRYDCSINLPNGLDFATLQVTSGNAAWL